MAEVKVFETFGELLDAAIHDGRPFENFLTKDSKYIVRFLPNATFFRANVVPQSAEDIISSTTGVFSLGKTSNGEIVIYSFIGGREVPETKVPGEILIEKHMAAMKENVLGMFSLKDCLELWATDRKTFEKYEEKLKLRRFQDHPDLPKVTDADFIKKTGKAMITQHDATVALQHKNQVFLDVVQAADEFSWSDSFLIDSYSAGFPKYLLAEPKISEDLLGDLLILELSEEHSKILFEKLVQTFADIEIIRKILLSKNPLGKSIRDEYKKFIKDKVYQKLFE
jgi:hypothetical protein